MYHNDMIHTIICTSYTKNIVGSLLCRIFKNKVDVNHAFKNR